MHGSIRDRLEDLLTADESAVGQDKNSTRELLEHLSTCQECATEFQAMKQQADLLRSLAAEEEVEPVVGFYGRVLQRIEETARDSIWAIFVDSPFGRRLVYASLALAMLLCTYVVAEESRDGHLGGNPIIAQDARSMDEPVMGSVSHQRDAVLVNFASYEEPRP